MSGQTEIIKKQAVIIGGGPAGLAAAAGLYREGVRDILILEREHEPGGILRQCIHDGFGLMRFGESLSGPEYAARFLDQIKELGISYEIDTTVTALSKDRIVTAASRRGLRQYQADAVILAMGCRERTRGALSIPGERPAGVFTAGVAQTYINLKNTMVGKTAVILGSGDIGMIMARRLTLEGAKVIGVFEIKPYAAGLARNIEQCLNDYDIPLSLSHTVTDIKGRSRLTSVTVSEVDENMRPIPGTEREYPCDTLILSVGLIPENELSRGAGIALDARTKGAKVDEFCQTSIPGIFAAGNVLQVHDLVDYVSLEAERLAKSAARMLREGALPKAEIPVLPGEGVGYVVPQRISGTEDALLSLRVQKPQKPLKLTVEQDGKVICSLSKKKAEPAVLLQLKLPKEKLLSQNPIKVVAHDEA